MTFFNGIVKFSVPIILRVSGSSISKQLVFSICFSVFLSLNPLKRGRSLIILNLSQMLIGRLIVLETCRNIADFISHLPDLYIDIKHKANWNHEIAVTDQSCCNLLFRCWEQIVWMRPSVIMSECHFLLKLYQMLNLENKFPSLSSTLLKLINSPCVVGCIHW